MTMTPVSNQPRLSSQSLWDQAIATLPQSEQANLPVLGDNKTIVLKSLVTTAQHARNVSIRKQWKLKRDNGQDIIARDILEKVLRAIHYFKEIGDVAVQFDPTHAALPWAGIRLLLQVC